MPNRVALLRAELEAAHPGAVMRHRGEAGFSMLLPDGSSEHRYTTGPWHWRQSDLDDWTEIDTDLEARPDATWKHGVKSARFDTLCTDDGRRRFYPRRWISTEYAEFGPLEYRRLTGQWRTVPVGVMSRAENRLLGADTTDSRLQIGFTGRGSRTEFVLKRATQARPLRWSVTLVGLSWQDGVLVSDSDGEQVGFIRPPTWTDSSDNPEPREIPWVYAGGYMTLTPDFTGAVYPVVVDPDYSIAAGGDDGYGRFITLGASPECDSFDSSATSFYLGTYTTGDGRAYMFFGRFDGIAADQGADCSSATVTMIATAAGQNSGTVDAYVYCVDEDDYASPADADGLETDYLARTTAYASNFDWDAAGAGGSGTTPDFSSAVSEVFDRVGWATGQALGVLIFPAVADLANRSFVASYDNTSYTEPVLSLTLAATPATVALGLLSAATLYAPTVKPKVVLPLLSAATLYAPTVAAEQSVTLPLIGAATLYAPTVENTVTLPLLSAATLWAPTLTPNIGLPLLSAASVHSPTVSVTVALPLLAAATTYAPTVTTATGDQDITLPALAATALYEPLLGLTSTIPILSPASLYEVTVTFGDQYLTLTLLGAASLHQPTLTFGHQYLTLSLLSPAGLYAPQLDLEGIVPLLAPTTLWEPTLCHVVMPDVIYALTMFQPTLAFDQQVTLELLAAGSLTAPDIQLTVTLPLLGAASLADLTLEQEQNIGLTLLAPVSLLDLLVAPEQAVTIPLVAALTILAPVIWYGRERLTWTVYLQGAVDGIAYVCRSTNPSVYTEPTVGEEVHVEVSRAASTYIEQSRNMTAER